MSDTAGFECPECRNTRSVCYPPNNRIVCSDCGFVLREGALAPEPKRSDKTQKTRSAQAASATKRIDEGVSESLTNNDDRGHGIVQEWKKRAKASDQTEKNIVFALSEITRIASCLSTSPKVLETASEIYKPCIEKRLIKGRSIRAFCAATVYIACRQCGYMRTLDEVAKYSKTNRKVISQCYSVLRKELNCQVPSVNLSRYASIYLDQLAIEGKTAEIVHKILKFAEELRLTSGKNPLGIISAAIYMASKLVGAKRTQREISELTRVTQTCIRNRCNDLEKRISFVMTL